MKSYAPLIVSFALILIFARSAFADSIVFPDSTLNGKIVYVLDRLTQIKTEDGLKSVVRDGDNLSYNDIVIAGFFKKKKITGNVHYVDSNTVEITTPTGDLKISRFNAKNIILFK